MTMNTFVKLLIAGSLQKLLLNIVLASLEDHMHVSALLGCSVDKTEDSLKQSELLLTKQLINTLQKNLRFQTVKFSFISCETIF